MNQSKPAVKYDMILAIRRLKQGNFAGLYEVVTLDAHGSVLSVVTDANDKKTALGLMASAAFRV